MDDLTKLVAGFIGQFFDDPKQVMVYSAAIVYVYTAIKGSLTLLRMLADKTSTKLDNSVVDGLAAIISFVDGHVPGLARRNAK